MVCISLGLMGGLMLFTFIVYVSFDLPEISSLEDYSPPIPSQILSKDGEVLMEVGIENRELIPIDQIPKRLVDSFLAAEDDNFYNHNGVDYLGVMRAMLANIKAGRVVQGGSTITQQVAKQLLLSRERSIKRKVKDFLLAQRIEEKFSKEEILYLYLNQVYLGGGYYGVKAAVKGYFDKELSEVSIAESALIAGLLVAPGKYSPYVNPKYAKIRQQYVLKRLFVTNKITEEEYKNAVAEDIRMRIRKRKGLKAGYFTDWIRQRVIALVGEERLIRDGFEIITTLDWKLQERAEEEVKKGVKDLDKRQGYKGHLGSIELDAELDEIEEAFRKKAYKRDSTFFIFNTDGTSTYEYAFVDSAEDKRQKEREEKKTKQEVEKLIVDENSSGNEPVEEAQEEGVTELTKLKAWRETQVEDVPEKYLKHYIVGNWAEDNFVKFLEVGNEYKATVIAVNNYQRAVYVSIGGIRAIIPYDGFKWAHERKIQEERHYWSYVTRPSQILRAGNRVLVKITGRNQSVWKHLYSDFKQMTIKPEIIRKIKAQKFLVAQLEQEPDVQGALLSLDPFSGEIIAMVGGYDFSRSQFNRVIQSNRQPGSAFKPLIFAAGLENGFTAASILLDSPQALGGADSNLNWKPRNYDGKFKGQMTFRTSLEKSRNIPTIKLVQEVGVKKITDFIKRIGVEVELPQDLSISLGSFGINLENLVKSYAIFPNGGKKIDLKSIISIKDRYGNLYSFEQEEEEDLEILDIAAMSKVNEPIVDKKPDEEKSDDEEGEKNEEDIAAEEEQINPYLLNLGGDQVYDERLAYLMTNLLRGVVQYGTGRNTSNISSFIGGKTGTTNSYVDAWFVGFSSNLVTGVWTGFDNNKTMGWAESGAKSALPIWRGFMESGLRRRGERDFTPPEGIVNVLIDRKSGKLAGSNTKESFMESFVEGTEPGVEEVVEDIEDIEENPGQIILEDDDYYSDQ
jgi:penicillin-binding protein 1A